MIRSRDSANFWRQVDAFLNDTMDQMQFYYGTNYIYLPTVSQSEYGTIGQFIV